MADLFISHSTEDVDWARELRRQLDQAGYTCWMAPDDVSGPVPWAEQIRMAIESCRVLIVVMSRTANTSSHVAKEVAVAIEHGKPMVPIRTEDVSPTGSLNYLLQLVQWIDAFPGSVADHVDRIRRAVASSIPTVPDSTASQGPGRGAPRETLGRLDSRRSPGAQARPARIGAWIAVGSGLTLGAILLATWFIGSQGGSSGAPPSPAAATALPPGATPSTAVPTAPRSATVPSEAPATPQSSGQINAAAVELTFPDLGYFWGVVATPIGKIAVGDYGRFPDADGWVWLINKGWERIAPERFTGEGNQLLRSVQSGEGGFVITGQVIENGATDGAIWFSKDGRLWERSTSEDLGGSGTQLVRNSVYADGTWTAVGRDGSQGALWTSTDGLIWHRSDDPKDVFVPEAGSLYLEAILPGVNGAPWVIVGRHRRVTVAGQDTFSASGYDPVAWFSQDGRTWTKAIVQLAGPNGSRMNAVVHFGSTWIAVGTTTYGTQDMPAIWRSMDGHNWSLVSEAIIGPGFLECVDSSGGIILAGGSLNGEAAAWQSTDGRTWSRISLVSTRTAREVEGVSIAGDGSFLLVGGTRTNDAAQFATAWEWD